MDTRTAGSKSLIGQSKSALDTPINRGLALESLLRRLASGGRPDAVSRVR